MTAATRIEACPDYELPSLARALEPFDGLLAEALRPGQSVTLKPNWLASHHRYDASEWRSVITHPNFITAVLQKVVGHLGGSGRVAIADSPQTDCQWALLEKRMHAEQWRRIGAEAGVEVEVLDLREQEFRVQDGVVLERRKRPGDPRGSVEFDLAGGSEFVGHAPSPLGYYGSDYVSSETTAAHSGGHHRYRVSRTVIESDVFINLPKWKTHKKAGITCSLKNLVGINTYKNFLPHHNEGTPARGGDQFPSDDARSSLEGALLRRFKAVLFGRERYGRLLVPVKRLGARVFGETRDQIRNGNWYGNDTIWRMILDLNKLLLYGEPDGRLRPAGAASRKPYLSIVDGIVAGEGNGPEAPDALAAGMILGGSDPVSVDFAAARLMGFDPRKIPSIANAFRIAHHPLVDFDPEQVALVSDGLPALAGPLAELPPGSGFRFEPHFGWKGHIELGDRAAA